ncbi:MAG: tetratricopeptide repeat protein [Phycisphaerae bacterium]
MAKRVNKKVVGVLTGMAFLLVTGTGLVLVGSMQKTDPAHWARLGEGSAAEQDWEQARYYYFRAYQVSKDPVYLVHAGEMQYRNGDERSAYAAWNEAVTQNPLLIEGHEKIIDLRIEIAEMFKQSEGWLGVKEAADALLEVDSQNAKGLFALGYALMELSPADGGDRVEGMEHVRRSAQLAPEVVKYSIKLVVYMLAEGKSDEVQRGLKSLVDRHTEPGADASGVRWAYGRFLGAMKRHQQAIKMFEQAEALAGDDQAVVASAKSYHAQYWTGRWYAGITDPDAPDDVEEYFDRARRLLRESIRLDAEGFLQYMLLAELVAYRGDYVKAIEICEERIGGGIQRQGLKATARKFALHRLLLKAADLSLAHAGTVEADSTEYDAMVAKAEQFCLEADSEIPDLGPALHSMGKVKLAQGNELEAIKYFQRCRDARGRMSWQNGKVLAQLLLRHNQPGAALEVINDTIANSEADASCWVIAAEAALATNDPATALRRANGALRRLPGDRAATRAKVAALRKLGQAELADSIAETIIQDSPLDIVFAAHLLNSEGMADKALALLSDLLEQEPDRVDALRLAVGILVKQDEHERAMALVNRALAKSPERHEIRLLAATADKNLSEEQRRRAQQEAINEIGDPFQRHYQLAILYGRHNMRAEYIDAVNAAEKHLAAPDNKMGRALKRRYLRDIYERQFLFAAKSRDAAAIERVIEKAARQDVDGAGGLTFRGRAQMQSGQTELALGTFKAAIEKQPTDAATLANVGQCHLSLDPPQVFEARMYFERAEAANPNLYAAQKGLAVIARVSGDEDEYVKRLERLAQLRPDDPWVEEQLLAQREEAAPLEGIERRLGIQAREPENMDNLMALARLYARTHQNEKASRCYETILALPEAGTGAVLAAANFHRRIGDSERALEMLEGLVQQAEHGEKKAEMVLLIARHWYEQGNRAEAEAALQRAVGFSESLEVCAAFARFKTDSGEYDQAAQWYGRAIELADGSSPEMAARFRRSRIDVLFRSQRYEEAQGEVQAFLDKYPNDESGLLMRSVLHTVRGEIDEAVAHLDRYLESQPTDANAILQRAGLYFSQGRYAVAIRDLERLRGFDPESHGYRPRMLLADGYVLTERLELAYQELESIIREDPGAKRVALHLIVMYRDNERFSDAVRVCTSMANRYPDDPAWVKNRGDVSSKLGDRSTALVDYESAARLSGYQPGYTAPLLQAYARFGQPDEGIAYYTKSIPADSRSAKVIMRYAELLAGAGRRAEAVGQFLAAFRASGFGDLTFARELIGAIINSVGQQEALDLFQAEPDNPGFKRTAEHVLALLLNHFNHDSEAMTKMTALLQTAVDDSERIMLLAALGNIHERRQDWQSAKSAYQGLLKIDDKHVLGLNNLAFLLSDKLDLSGEALPYARRAAGLYPTSSVRDTLAWTHVQLGEYRQAIAILTRLLRDHPRFVPGIYHLAEAYRRNNEPAKARDLLEGALNLINKKVGENYRDKVLEALGDLNQGESTP